MSGAAEVYKDLLLIKSSRKGTNYCDSTDKVAERLHVKFIKKED
ncbi:hypothetical protein GCM10027291_07090 [Telluribacter humicola]